jgi:hypothetical protein
MDITIVTSARTDLICKTLLELCCFPFNWFNIKVFYVKIMHDKKRKS